MSSKLARCVQVVQATVLTVLYMCAERETREKVSSSGDKLQLPFKLRFVRRQGHETGNSDVQAPLCPPGHKTGNLLYPSLPGFTNTSASLSVCLPSFETNNVYAEVNIMAGAQDEARWEWREAPLRGSRNRPGVSKTMVQHWVVPTDSTQSLTPSLRPRRKLGSSCDSFLSVWTCFPVMHASSGSASSRARVMYHVACFRLFIMWSVVKLEQ